MESVFWSDRSVVQSKAFPGVTFVVDRMTFGRRVALMRHVRDLAAKAEFFEAGHDQANKMEASLLAAEIDRLYVLWGLAAIRGLELAEGPATPETLVESGPEELFREVLAAVRAECGLSEEERKN